MKLKRYSEYVNEELTPMAGAVQNPDVEEAPIVAPPDTDTQPMTRPWTPIPTRLPEPGTEEQPIGMTGEEEEGDSFIGDDLLKEFAELVGAKVNNGIVSVGDKQVSFASETNTFVISTEEKKNRNTRTDNPQELYDKEFANQKMEIENTEVLQNKMY